MSIESITYSLPSKVLTSVEIERSLGSALKKLRVPVGTLESLTGIKERRVWPTSIKPSSIASHVAKRLIDKTKVIKSKIECLLYTGVCRDFIEPATAHIIHDELGLSENCMSLDISDACLGFLKGLVMGANMIETGQVKTVLVTSAENANPLYEKTLLKLKSNPEMCVFKESLASLTLGSAAVACLLRCSSESTNGHKLKGWVSKTASQYNNLCRGEGNYQSPLMITDSLKLMKEGIILAKKTWNKFLLDLNWSDGLCKHVFTHQVSGAHHQKFFESAGIDLEIGHSESSWLGNTGTVAAPLSLAIAEDKNILNKGDKVALLGIGSGISSLMMGIEW